MGLKGLDKHYNNSVNDVLGKVPSTISQRLLYVISGLVILFIIIACIFKYPDKVDAEIIITSTNPPINLIARQNGKIQNLFVENNEQVKKADIIAVIENSANIDDIRELLSIIQRYNSLTIKNDSIFQNFYPQLGEMQSAYLSFKDALHQYSFFSDINYYPQKISAIEIRIKSMIDYKNKSQTQLRYKNKELEIINTISERDSLLYKKGILATIDNEQTQIQHLQTLSNIAAMEGTLSNIETQIDILRENVLDLQLQFKEKQDNLETQLHESYENLKNSLRSWEINYLLKAPIEGKVVFTNFWSINQNVKIGDIVFTILPNNKNDLIGKGTLATLRAGKVKIGQQVKVKLNNYPDTEFGTIQGIINNISEIPINNSYVIEISFPNGLTTSYNLVLHTNQDLTGTAMIITEDLKLIERLFMPIRKLFTESIQ